MWYSQAKHVFNKHRLSGAPRSEVELCWKKAMNLGFSHDSFKAVRSITQNGLIIKTQGNSFPKLIAKTSKLSIRGEEKSLTIRSLTREKSLMTKSCRKEIQYANSALALKVVLLDTLKSWCLFISHATHGLRLLRENRSSCSNIPPRWKFCLEDLAEFCAVEKDQEVWRNWSGEDSSVLALRVDFLCGPVE